MGLPVARFRVVITTCSLSFAMGPGCFHALPISSSRLTTFGARRPSRVGGAFRIKLQCSAIQRLKPLVHHGRHRLESSIRVPLLPETNHL